MPKPTPKPTHEIIKSTPTRLTQYSASTSVSSEFRVGVTNGRLDDITLTFDHNFGPSVLIGLKAPVARALVKMLNEALGDEE